MAASPDPVHPSNEAPAYASNISLTLSLKGQTVQTYEFNRESISVGRDPLCEIYVDNPGVSRQHFRITRGEQGDYRIADQGSSNGTYLNDRPIQVASLRDGDTIQFSKYSLLVGLEELVGGKIPARSSGPAVGDGATVMLSPSEVRGMMADTRQQSGGAPVRNAAPVKSNVPPPSLRVVRPSSAPPVFEPQSSNGWVVWLVVGVAAVALAALVAWWMNR